MKLCFCSQNVDRELENRFLAIRIMLYGMDGVLRRRQNNKEYQPLKKMNSFQDLRGLYAITRNFLRES
jgi:hypothetical protein